MKADRTAIALTPAKRIAVVLGEQACAPDGAPRTSMASSSTIWHP
jgi:hypothetical protein